MRIVCLSAEAADICARLDAWDDVVAVSAFASQDGLEPRQVIGGFSKTDCERIASLAPDLVLCFSDVQAEIAAQLVRLGCPVLTTNQRTLAEIASAIRLIGGAIGRAAAGEALARKFLDELDALRDVAEPRPRVYFEEWPDPLISGIGWVGELIELCGGFDVFATRRGRASRDRVVQPAEVMAADPDILIASWCGKPVDVAAIQARPGFAGVRAVIDAEIHILDSDIVLQPGPRLLTGGRKIQSIIGSWQRRACIRLAAHPR